MGGSVFLRKRNLEGLGIYDGLGGGQLFYSISDLLSVGLLSDGAGRT